MSDLLWWRFVVATLPFSFLYRTYRSCMMRVVRIQLISHLNAMWSRVFVHLQEIIWPKKGESLSGGMTKALHWFHACRSLHWSCCHFIFFYAPMTSLWHLPVLNYHPHSIGYFSFSFCITKHKHPVWFQLQTEHSLIPTNAEMILKLNYPVACWNLFVYKCASLLYRANTGLAENETSDNLQRKVGSNKPTSN